MHQRLHDREQIAKKNPNMLHLHPYMYMLMKHYCAKPSAHCNSYILVCMCKLTLIPIACNYVIVLCAADLVWSKAKKRHCVTNDEFWELSLELHTTNLDCCLSSIESSLRSEEGHGDQQTLLEFLNINEIHTNYAYLENTIKSQKLDFVLIIIRIFQHENCLINPQCMCKEYSSHSVCVCVLPV